MSNIIENITQELIILTDPVIGASNDDYSLQQFFKPMGWNFEENSGMPLANTVNSIGQINLIIQTCQELIESEDTESLENVFSLLSSLKTLFESINGLVNSFDGANLNTAQIEEVATDILHHLAITYMQKKKPILSQLLILIEVIQTKKGEETQFNSSGKIIRYPYQFEVLNFDNLSKFIQNPVEHFKSLYITPFDRNAVSGAKEFTDKLFPKIGNIASSLGAISVYGVKPAYEIDFGTIGNAMASGALTIKMETPLDEIKAGATILYSPRDRGDLGWVIVPFGEIALDQVLGKYYFLIHSALNVGGIIIGNDGNVSFDSSNGLSSVFIDILAQKLAEDDTNLAYLIGEKEGTRLEIGSISIGSNLGFSIEKVEFDVHFDLSDAKFVISGGGQDSFISKLIPSEGMEIPFEFLLGYSSIKGLYFNASAGLELAIPVHISLLDILRIDIIYLKIKTQDYGIKAETSITGGASLGPLSVSFEEIGLQSKLDWIKKDKNIGFADFSLDFKPPNGLGLSLNAGAVIGGGYLFFDFEKEEYAGALELTIAGFISAKAIGLITTKMPDGSKGFSMIVIITAEFFPPFQLGYGFTLIGLGGLLGLNRTVLLDPLRDGVRTGAVNNIMFPTNVIANAPRIISDLKTIFPVYEFRFLIGPMAKIGWGTPSLITLSFGLIIEIPGNIAILGVLKLILPDEKIPTVKIQVAFVGTIDFDRKMLTFDASLYESNILQTMTLEGDMAVRLAWGDQPNFIMTVGGFHPSFTPPPLALPTLRRLAINILNTSIARIRVECYQAVTSNTVQFGARAEIFFDLKACSINGHIGFDALFQFNPFYFIIELSSGFNLKAVGINVMTVKVKMSLEGPTPWHAKGTGKVSLLFFDISADFDKSWGQSKTTTLPQINILPLFREQLQKKEQWNTVLSTGKNLTVSLRTFREATESLLVLHPAGSLILQQKLLPLKVNIDKIGNQKTADVKHLTIDSASSNGIPLSIKEVKESFARAQFQNLNDAEKLSKPSFEKMQGGVEISMGDNTIQNGKMVRKKIEYELTVIDKDPVNPLPFGKFFLEHGIMFNHFIKGNSVSKLKLSRNTLEKLQPFEQKLDMQEELFTVAFQNNNKAYNPNSTFNSELEAQSFMQDQIRSNPNLRKQIHIVPQFELQES